MEKNLIFYMMIHRIFVRTNFSVQFKNINLNKNKPNPIASFKSWFLNFIKRGTSANDLAIALTLGFLIGIMPFIGATTILSTIIALRWRLNLPIILAVTYIIFPVQIVLLLPFYKLAAFVFKVQYMLPSTDSFLTKIHQDWIKTVSGIGIVNLLAVLVWFVCSLITGWFFYKAFYWLVKKYRK
jgi:uncharacterized protein (DUF2062 family)